MEMARKLAGVLAGIDTRLAMVLSGVLAQRTTLAEAASMLREDIDANKILVAGAVAVVPARDDPADREATLAAAAKLVSSVFSEAPVLPGAISAAMDLVLSGYEIPSQDESQRHRHGERMREAWKIEEIVLGASQDMDAALVAIHQVRHAVATEEQIVRDAIDDVAL
ncbi:hypothetical protein E2562_036575 [Oryza meyeriana var. granulata]|uniref:Uncharacterized protein n=1 Tax=Oryza meyeriana var. granulata TaxID=110450 RepID=A0A6G1ECJ3_9ORYZ|nr:hypothetical protein E2562_036575 [Oryza meyeriana var. granulata]